MLFIFDDHESNDNNFETRNRLSKSSRQRLQRWRSQRISYRRRDRCDFDDHVARVQSQNCSYFVASEWYHFHYCNDVVDRRDHFIERQKYICLWICDTCNHAKRCDHETLIEQTKIDESIMYHEESMCRHWYSLNNATQVKFKKIIFQVSRVRFKTLNKDVTFEKCKNWAIEHRIESHDTLSIDLSSSQRAKNLFIFNKNLIKWITLSIFATLRVTFYLAFFCFILSSHLRSKMISKHLLILRRNFQRLHDQHNRRRLSFSHSRSFSLKQYRRVKAKRRSRETLYCQCCVQHQYRFHDAFSFIIHRLTF